jgi:hypothetical protein
MLNMAKESAARVLAAERRAAALAGDVAAAKEEGVATLCRLKGIMEDKVRPPPPTFSNRLFWSACLLVGWMDLLGRSVLASVRVQLFSPIIWNSGAPPEFSRFRGGFGGALVLVLPFGILVHGFGCHSEFRFPNPSPSFLRCACASELPWEGIFSPC